MEIIHNICSSQRSLFNILLQQSYVYSNVAIIHKHQCHYSYGLSAYKKNNYLKTHKLKHLWIKEIGDKCSGIYAIMQA